MIQLIVNADDLGLTQAVNKGILYAHREGIVTSATLMANGPAFDSAVSISRQAPRLGIGVHLNLTSGEPVSPAAKIPSLVDCNGRFHLTPGRFLQALLMGRVDLGHVEKELRCQIAKIFGAGIVPSHLDGHKHMHVLPGVSKIVIRLAEEFSIRRVRCPYEVAPNLRSLLRYRTCRGAVMEQYLVGRAVSSFARGFMEKLAKSGLQFPARFYGLSQTGFLQTGCVLDLLEGLPNSVSELMCHPGYLDNDLVAAGTRLLTQREIEIQALTAPTVKTLVADLGIQLISYRDLETNTNEPVPVTRRATIWSPNLMQQLERRLLV